MPLCVLKDLFSGTCLDRPGENHSDLKAGNASGRCSVANLVSVRADPAAAADSVQPQQPLSHYSSSDIVWSMISCMPLSS